METGLKGKRVLITGAATGIGRATALELAKYGCDIMINYFPSLEGKEEAQKLAGEICEEIKKNSCKSIVFPADISDESQVISMFTQLMKDWGGLDVLVNNAGIQKKSPSHQLSLDEFNRIITTNMTGTFLCSREALKIFLSQKIKGTIINNTSVHQLIPKPQYLSYSMSKGAVANLTRTLALEYAPQGIRVNSVAPGAIETGINPWAHNEKKEKEIEKHIPLHSVGKAEEIARAIRFLASDESNYITGQTLFVDGGLTLYPDFGSDWSSS
ncbi:SDR family oxidoreductase [Peredibacter sp. HCB2-198]|uniref:SDR family oxidoreductase n=1 Tax=Peredibacter sp. HCB2-198 TaxID=3383025 RepID=UPI0038B50A30